MQKSETMKKLSTAIKYSQMINDIASQIGASKLNVQSEEERRALVTLGVSLLASSAELLTGRDDWTRPQAARICFGIQMVSTIANELVELFGEPEYDCTEHTHETDECSAVISRCRITTAWPACPGTGPGSCSETPTKLLVVIERQPIVDGRTTLLCDEIPTCAKCSIRLGIQVTGAGGEVVIDNLQPGWLDGSWKPPYLENYPYVDPTPLN